MKSPIGTSVVAYLLFKSINPHGAMRGALLTLFIGYLILLWSVFISQIWLYELSEPKWKD